MQIEFEFSPNKFDKFNKKSVSWSVKFIANAPVSSWVFLPKVNIQGCTLLLLSYAFKIINFPTFCKSNLSSFFNVCTKLCYLLSISLAFVTPLKFIKLILAENSFCGK